VAEDFPEPAKYPRDGTGRPVSDPGGLRLDRQHRGDRFKALSAGDRGPLRKSGAESGAVGTVIRHSSFGLRPESPGSYRRIQTAGRIRQFHPLPISGKRTTVVSCRRG